MLAASQRHGGGTPCVAASARCARPSVTRMRSLRTDAITTPTEAPPDSGTFGCPHGMARQGRHRHRLFCPLPCSDVLQVPHLRDRLVPRWVTGSMCSSTAQARSMLWYAKHKKTLVKDMKS